MLIVKTYMKTKTIIFDGSNLLHRCHWVSKVRPNVRTELLFLNSLKKIANVYPHDDIFCVWDHKEDRKTKSFRSQSLSGEYKSNRDKSKIEEVYEKCDLIQKLSSYLGVIHLHPYVLEADDYIRWISCKRPCVVVSSDSDLIQLVSEACSVYNPIKDIEIDKTNFRDITSVDTPEDFIKYKALVGDKSDNIPGIEGIGNKRALKIIRENMYDKLSEDNINILNKNIELIDLSVGIHMHAGEEDWYEKLYNREVSNKKIDMCKFKNMCKKLNLNTIHNNVKDWSRVFDKTQTIENVVDKLIRLNM